MLGLAQGLVVVARRGLDMRLQRLAEALLAAFLGHPCAGAGGGFEAGVERREGRRRHLLLAASREAECGGTQKGYADVARALARRRGGGRVGDGHGGLLLARVRRG